MMKNGKFLWSKEDTLKLIKLYKSFPWLWNSTMADYRDKKKRHKTLIKISIEFKTSVPEVQRKLHILRCSLNQEIRRLKSRNACSNWEFFESMDFLLEHYKRQTIVPTPSSMEMRSSKNLPSTKNDNSTEIKNEIKCRAERRELDYALPENECPMNGICQAAKPYDDYQTFGNFVGSELRGLSCPYKTQDLKRMILQSILTVTDPTYVSPTLKHSDSYDDQSTSSLASMVSVENDSGLVTLDSNDDHEFFINNHVKLEIQDV